MKIKVPFKIANGQGFLWQTLGKITSYQGKINFGERIIKAFGVEKTSKNGKKYIHIRLKLDSNLKSILEKKKDKRSDQDIIEEILGE